MRSEHTAHEALQQQAAQQAAERARWAAVLSPSKKG